MKQLTLVVVAAAALQSVGAHILMDHDCVASTYYGVNSCADITVAGCTTGTYASDYQYICPITCNNTGGFTIENYTRDTPEPYTIQNWNETEDGKLTCADIVIVGGCSLAATRLFCPCTCNTPLCNNASICQEWVPVASSNCSGTASTVLLNSNEVSYPKTDQYFDVGTQSRDFYLHSPSDVRVAVSSTVFRHVTTIVHGADSILDIPAKTFVKLTVELDSYNYGLEYTHTGQLAIKEIECGYNVAELNLHYCPSTCSSASTTSTTTTLTTITAFAPGAQCNCGDSKASAPPAPPRPNEEKAFDRTLVVLASLVIVATVASVVVSLRKKGSGYTTLESSASKSSDIEMTDLRSWPSGFFKQR